ncbi:helix-turn-helix domain-containing protein [Tepidibacillus infernus]|uniref:HTH cro/C1-type domain-containing protein n=1 Tax=Tepidibacillus decaturensis TaxID=1413211 RepID=A0A135L3M4_9BACI|nr:MULTISPECIES: helix-turn-helix domain-containing protein [Tepidibacillus]KXG43453.1 hypothetical protein U473_05080 [Tepidibacillus decaturensis]GBF11317.1 cytoskeletal protein RodZ [Tepidibacillus sp. HK-1]
MSELGNMLKEVRIKKGYTIEEIQEITKIRSRYIQAIEDGNLDKLPGQFYAKAFIKSYAEVLELDPSVLEEYESSLNYSKPEEITIHQDYQSMAGPPSKWGKWLVKSLVYILIGLILLFIYRFIVTNFEKQPETIPGKSIEKIDFSTTEPPPKKQEQDQTSTNNGQNSTINPGKENQQTKSNLQITKVNSSTYKNRPMDVYEILAPVNEKVELQLKFIGESWYDIRQVDAKGKQIMTGIMNNGQETEKIKLDQPIWVHLGYAANVELYINDEKIKAGIEDGPKYISIVRKEPSTQVNQ